MTDPSDPDVVERGATRSDPDLAEEVATPNDPDARDADDTPAPGPRMGLGRRRFLRVAAAGTVLGAVGCLGGLDEAGQRPLSENPVAANLQGRPRLGPGHGETPVTLVAFDDPSCPYCAKLSTGAMDRIESEWVAEGRATVYNRSYYFVEDWSRPAINGLLAAWDRDPDAYRHLEAAYFRHQDDLSVGNVAERTAGFLDGTDLAPEPVVAAVRDRPHASRIDADVEAAERAGIDGVPTVFVFDEGEFVTTLGNDDFEAYRSAVESNG
ncbi:hypothetical protein BRD00_12720 [Halobacteriales archaeon QS_8_69_26]|nr:MAG: hypothetical protein BRD00_12720 [Halobacteriales archaeon QS_8_69_26]